jgi:chemotaxis protein CheD
MDCPEDTREAVLQPGDFHFGDRTTRIRTLLGSCVAITMWHPRALIGGMCHYLLPERPDQPPGSPTAPPDRLDGRYAEDAVDLFLAEIRAAGTSPTEYVVKMFGGGNQFPQWSADGGVAGRNVEAGLALLARHGLPLRATHLGGHGHRHVILDLWDGEVWVRHIAATATGPGLVPPENPAPPEPTHP